MLKKCVKIISVFLCAVLIFQSLEIGIFATTEQTEETTPEDEIFCLCENCTEYECSCECETEEACTCVQCKRTAYTEYDDFGNVIAEKSFDGTKTLVSEQSVYSEDGTQLLSSTDSSGNTAYYTYNDAGLVETVSAGSSSGTATYDEAGNLLSFSQNVSGLSDGNVMSNSYTYENNKVKTISHNGFTYEFEYDEQGNLIIAKIGTTILAQNTFNTVGENSFLAGTVFANGQSVSYSYDETGNITAVFYGDTERYSYAYDEEGILLNVTDNRSGLKTVYTDNGVQLVNAEDNFLLFSLAVDDNGNETHNIAGDSVTYLYNTDYNSQTGVYTDTVSFESEKAITEDGVTTSYINQGNAVTNTDWFGRLFSKALSLDIIVDDEEFEANSSFLYNYADTDTTASTKITSISSEITANEAVFSQQEYYEYDAVGNITGIYRLAENEKIYYNKYYYDEANQIIREDNRLGEFSCTYIYDVGGNIVSRIKYPYTEGELTELTATETNTYSYNNSVFGDLLTGYNGQNVSYDNMGNIIGLDGMEYQWTAGRQLSRMTDADSGSYIDYNYDDNGMLNYYAVYDEDGNITGACGYCWDDTKLVAMKAIEFSYDGDSVVIEESFQSRIIYDSDGEALGYLLDDSIPYLYTKNILGDITGVINGLSGELVVSYIYDAFGNPMLKTPNGTWAEFLNALIVLISNPLTYRGYMYSFATGYSYYLGSRFYVPNLCRFMNADVYYDTDTGVLGTNMFIYCSNNPIMFADPEGTLASAILSIYKTMYNFSYFMRAYNYCEKYYSRNYLFNPLLRPTFDVVTYNKNGTIVLSYKQNLKNYRYTHNHTLIEHSVKEWYEIIYMTFREKYIWLDWICTVVEKNSENAAIFNLILQYFKPNWDIMSYYEFAEFLVFLIDEYDNIRKDIEEDNEFYSMFFSPWEQFVIKELKKYTSNGQQSKLLMFHRYIDTSCFTRYSPYSNRYISVNTTQTEPWRE